MARKSYESKTPTWQRLTIWIIAIAMAGGTILTYVVILIANNNTAANPTQIAYEKYLENEQKKNEDLLKQQEEAKAKYVVFDDAYVDKIAPYDINSVSELKVTTLKEGNGAIVKEADTISANYTGWDINGKIFDTTRKESSSAALPVSFPLQNVITGWTQGLTGQKVGGVYLLEIPAVLAYSDAAYASSDLYQQPLKFLVEVKEIQ
jgi:FKBP-type peptidyl-prolyl cis-trans isomerase